MFRLTLPVLAIVGLCECASRRQSPPPGEPSASPSGRTPRDAPAVAVTENLPSVWTQTAPGVQWRGARLPFEAPPPTVIAWATEPHELEWVVVRIDLAQVQLAMARSPDDHLGGVSRDPELLAAVDGGYFEPDYSPSGLLVSNGVVLSQPNPRAGTGILVVKNGMADVWTSQGFDASVRATEGLLIQCGPRLVEQGGVAGIHRDDGRRYARTAACVRDGGRTLDLVTTWNPIDPLRGPGLFQFAQMLASPSPVGDAKGCEVALNLDGGPSTGVYVRDAYHHDPVGPVPWVLEVRRLARSEPPSGR